MQLLNGIGALKLDELVAVAGLHPADAEIGDQETHQVTIAKVGHKGGPLAIKVIATHITSGHQPLLTHGFGQGLEAQDEILNQGSVLLSKAGKHGPQGGDLRILRFSSVFRGQGWAFAHPCPANGFSHRRGATSRRPAR